MYTKGKWMVGCIARGKIRVAHGNGLHKHIADVTIHHYAGKKTDDHNKEAMANATLIAEGGTVANETGYTPRQLADQKAALLEACKDMASILNGLNVNTVIGLKTSDLATETEHRARAAIAAAQT